MTRINGIKEQLGYIAYDFDTELKKASKGRGGRLSEVAKEYVLPDYQTIMAGYVKEETPEEAAARLAGKPKQLIQAEEDDGPTTLRLNNERFTVPELLYHPSDIGLLQGGIADSVQQAINACAPELRPALWGNVVLLGGTVKLPGFQARLEKELRALAPVDCELQVTMPEDPVTASWKGGAMFAELSTFDQWVVTKQEYQEFGDEICRRRFMC